MIGNIYPFRAKRPKHLKKWLKEGHDYDFWKSGYDNEKYVRDMAEQADLIVCAWGCNHPSIPECSTAWLEHEECPTLPLLAVQDGIRPEHVVDLVGPEVGLAVGGSTEWKLRTLHAWGKLAQRTGCYVHALRVNTLVRLNLCRDAGIHSFDGSGASRFYKAGLVMSAGLRQQHLMEVKP